MRQRLCSIFAMIVPVGAGLAQDCNPVFLDSVMAPGDVRRMVVQDGFAYAVWPSAAVHIFDVSDPADLQFVGNFAPPGMAPDVVDITLVGELLYVLDVSCVSRYDLSTPGAPVYLGRSCYPTNSRRFVLEGTTLYVAGGFELVMLDVTDPTAPALLGRFEPGLHFADVEVFGDFVLVGSAGDTDAFVVDISDPENASIVTPIDLPGSGPFCTARQGSVALVGNSGIGSAVRTIDMSDPALPVVVTTLDLPGDSVYDIEIEGDRAFVSIGDSGVAILDISDALNPTHIDTWAIGQRVRAAKAYGSLLYVGTDSDFLRTADVSSCTPCPADFTDDGVLDFFDVAAFLDAFSAQEPAGDFNDDGSFDFFDVADFLDAFSQGCP